MRPQSFLLTRHGDTYCSWIKDVCVSADLKIFFHYKLVSAWNFLTWRFILEGNYAAGKFLPHVCFTAQELLLMANFKRTKAFGAREFFNAREFFFMFWHTVFITCGFLGYFSQNQIFSLYFLLTYFNTHEISKHVNTDSMWVCRYELVYYWIFLISVMFLPAFGTHTIFLLKVLTHVKS